MENKKNSKKKNEKLSSKPEGIYQYQGNRNLFFNYHTRNVNNSLSSSKVENWNQALHLKMDVKILFLLWRSKIGKQSPMAKEAIEELSFYLTSQVENVLKSVLQIQKPAILSTGFGVSINNTWMIRKIPSP